MILTQILGQPLLFVAMSGAVWLFFDFLVRRRSRVGDNPANAKTVAGTRAGGHAPRGPVDAEEWEHDLTEHSCHERGIGRLNRLFSTLNAVNHAILRVHSRDELFQEVCRIAVEHAGFKVVWVGWLDTESSRVDPVAQAGDSQGYLDKIRAYADDRPEGRGPVGLCIRRGEPCILNDLATDARAQQWRELMAAHGLRSVAALPVRFDGHVVGALVVYTEEENAFHENQIALLEQVTSSIAFALNHLEQETKRRQSEDQLATVVATVPGAIFSFHLHPDGSSCCPCATPQFAELFGIPRKSWQRIWSASLRTCIRKIFPP